jgi:hypothetical protein
MKNDVPLQAIFNGTVDLDDLPSEARALLLRAARKYLTTASVADLWKIREVTSYWVLLISGTSRTEHLDIARELLAWSAFSTRETSKVVCIQIADGESFNMCAKHFATTEYPALYLGTSPEMSTYVGMPKSVLVGLCSKAGALHDFLTETHTALVKGDSLADINKRLLKDRTKHYAGIVYRELRSIISLKGSADVSVKM